MNRGILVLLFLVLVVVDGQVTNSFTLQSQCRDSLLAGEILGDDAQITMHKVVTLQKLGAKIPQEEQICGWALALLNKDSSLATIHAAAQVNNLLSCGAKELPSIIEETIEDSEVLEDLYYAIEASAAMKIKSQHLATLPERLKRLFDEFEGLFHAHPDAEVTDSYSTGLALVALSHVESASSLMAMIGAVKERVDDTLGHADTGEDWLSFEGREGRRMEATALIISGLMKLNIAIGDKIGRLAEYVVTHQSCETPSEAYFMMMALEALSSAKNAPAALVVQTPVLSLTSKDVLRVTVSDVLGKPIKGARVTLVRAASSTQEDASAIASNQQFDEVNGVFEFNILAASPEPGYYTLELAVSGPVEVKATERILKITSTMDVTDLKMSVIGAGEAEADQDHIYTLATTSDSLSSTVTVDEHQKLNIQFKTSVLASCHQTMIRFTKGSEVHYVHAAAKIPGLYSVTVTTGLDGDYHVDVIVGDMFMENSIVWPVGTLSIHLGGVVEEPGASMYSTPKEIEHIFRAPDSRPPKAVSTFFTFVVLTPLAVLAAGLFYLRANFDLFPTSGMALINAVGFMASLIAGVALLVMFWLSLDMFTTLKYLAVIAVFGTYFGVKALSDVATKRVKKE